MTLSRRLIRSGISRTTRPIANRFAELFSLSPLIVALVVAFLMLCVEFGLFMGLPLVALLLIYVFWITPNYFFEIIEFKALGNAGWPVFSHETLVGGRSQIGIVFTALVLAAAGSYMALQYFEKGGLAQVLIAACMVLLPGSMALLAVTREFSVALNPFRVLAAVLGMGVAYLGCLFGAVAILVLLEFALERGGLHFYFPLVFGLFLQAYMIGSIVYARRTELGVTTPRSPEARAERLESQTVAIRKRVLSHAYGFAVHGNRAGSLAHIEEFIRNEEDTLEARLWFFHEMVRWERNDVALKFGQLVIDYCEQHESGDAAGKIRSMCNHLSMHDKPGSDREAGRVK